MKTILIILAICYTTSASAATFCTTRGKNTYCDNGNAWHETPAGGIVPWGTNKGQPSYHKYGDTLYGSDGSRRTKTGKGKVNSRHHEAPSSKDRVIDEIFGDDDW